jgi:hypothetical protein
MGQLGVHSLGYIFLLSNTDKSHKIETKNNTNRSICLIAVWPRLLIFAESVTANPQVLARWLSFLVTFLSSAQFQSFVKDWEEGKPLGTCLKSVLNSDVFSTALQLAPNLFAQLKGRNLKT